MQKKMVVNKNKTKVMSKTSSFRSVRSVSCSGKNSFERSSNSTSISENMSVSVSEAHSGLEEESENLLTNSSRAISCPKSSDPQQVSIMWEFAEETDDFTVFCER